MAAANQAVVGILRAMLTADTASFDTGMGKANTTLKLVETNTKKVGAEVQKLTPQAERMVKAFSGDKLLYSANSLVTAITKIGGATKLTEQEQAKANKTLTDAIAKYAAMGQVAPKAMLDLEQATRKATQATSAMTAGMSAAAKQSASSIALIGGMSQSGRDAAASLTKVTQATNSMTAGMSAAAKQSAASINLIGGMSKAGREAAASLASVEKPASFLTTKMVALGAAAGSFISLMAFQGVRTLINFGKQAFETASQITDLADKTGLSTATIQRMQFVAGQTGTSLDAMTTAAFRLGVQIAGGSKSVEKGVVALGLSFEAIQKMRPDQQFEAIVSALGKYENAQERNRIGVLLFGRQFAEIAAAVEQGYEQIASAASEASDAQLQALDKAGDRWDAFVQNTRTGVTAFLGQMLLMSDAIEQVSKSRGWMNGPAQDYGADYGRAYGEVVAEAQRLVQTGQMGARKEDIVLTEKQVQAQKTYAQQLAAVQKELAALTAAQRREIDAAQQLGVSNEDLELKYGLTEGALRILTTSTKDYAKTAKDSAEEAKKAAEAQKAWLASISDLVPIFSRWIQVGNDANDVVKDSMALYTAMPPAIDAAAASIEGRLIPAASGLAAAFESTARAKASMDELMEGGFLSAPSAIRSEDASGEVAERRAAEVNEVWKALTEGATRSIQMMDTAIAGSFAQMMLGAKSFKEGYLDIWKSIQAGVANILGEILSFFTKQFLGGLIKSLSSAKLAQSIGNAIAGGVSGTALGGGASAVGGAGGIGGAGLAAFATNPFTLAALGGAALGVAIWKGGLFRGGEEATDISPRRDRFFGQLQDMFGGTQFEAAVTASQKARIPGGAAERMIGAVYGADSKNAYDSAQMAFVSALNAGGLKNVKGYNLGGFVPPGVVQPAILHGGRFGEDIVPRTSAGSGAKIELHQHYNTTFNSHAMNTEGFDRVFKNEFLPRLHFEYRLNQQGTVTVLEKALVR